MSPLSTSIIAAVEVKGLVREAMRNIVSGTTGEVPSPKCPGFEQLSVPADADGAAHDLPLLDLPAQDRVGFLESFRGQVQVFGVLGGTGLHASYYSNRGGRYM
jgi:hypothetical protein